MRGDPKGGAVAKRPVTVDADAIDEAARLLASLRDAMHDELAGLRDRAVAAYGAIPASDLHDAYGYCWGRWSQVLLDSLDQLAMAATAAHRVADEWRDTERAVVRRANDAASKGDTRR